MNLYEFREEPQRNTRNPIVKGERRLYTLTGPARKAGMLSLGDSMFLSKTRTLSPQSLQPSAAPSSATCRLYSAAGMEHGQRQPRRNAAASVFIAEDGGQ